MSTHYKIRFATNTVDSRNYSTEQVRDNFLIENLFIKDEIQLIYSHYDRFIIRDVKPDSSSLILESIDPLKSEYFLERLKLRIINVGDSGSVTIDGEAIQLKNRKALYSGKCLEKILF